jgi:thiol-disulfide isomerase/thioredoxin
MPMPRLLLLIGLFAGGALAAAAEDGIPLDARLKAIEARVAAAEDAVAAARARLTDPSADDPEMNRLGEAAQRTRAAAFDDAIRIARDAAQSDAGFAALAWLLSNAPGVYANPAGKEALELVTRNYAADPRIAPAIGRVALYPPYGLPIDREEPLPKYSVEYRPAMDLLAAVVAQNPDRSARGQAALGLALQAKRACQYVEYKRGPDADPLLRTKAVRALRAVETDFGDVACLGARKGAKTLGERAAAELFELVQLSPGKIAPEIEGTDLGGAKLKLSDYRGRVVLLVFWASWCGPCMAEVPHERSLLLDRYKGRPFAVVGVNGNEDPAAARRAAADKRIVWRSFSNGPDGAYGPINSAWNVRFLPTVYVIDDLGTIRHVGLEGKAFDEALDRLVGEAGERAKGK